MISDLKEFLASRPRSQTASCAWASGTPVQGELSVGFDSLVVTMLNSPPLQTLIKCHINGRERSEMYFFPSARGSVSPPSSLSWRWAEIIPVIYQRAARKSRRKVEGDPCTDTLTSNSRRWPLTCAHKRDRETQWMDGFHVSSRTKLCHIIKNIFAGSRVEWKPVAPEALETPRTRLSALFRHHDVNPRAVRQIPELLSWWWKGGLNVWSQWQHPKWFFRDAGTFLRCLHNDTKLTCG